MSAHVRMREASRLLARYLRTLQEKSVARGVKPSPEPGLPLSRKNALHLVPWGRIGAVGGLGTRKSQLLCSLLVA